MVEMVLDNLVLAFWRLYRHKKSQTRSLSESSRDAPHHYATIRQVSVCLANGRTERQAKESSVCNVKYKLFVSSLNCYPLGCASTSQSFRKLLNQDLYYIILT